MIPGKNKRHICVPLFCLGVFLFPGCATMSDDDKTKAQGSVFGAVAGAIVGGGLGALAGLAAGEGRAEDIIIGAIAGGVAGGAVGGVAGYHYGMMVAQKKAEYRSSEEFYLSQIQEIDAATAQMRIANADLSKQVASLQKRRRDLDRALAAGAVDRHFYNQEVAAIRRQARNLRQQAEPATQLVNIQRAVLKDAEQSGTTPYISDELIRAGAEQEEAYAPLEETLDQLSTVGQPTRG
jgi:uncharacterized protein YcfJ